MRDHSDNGGCLFPMTILVFMALILMRGYQEKQFKDAENQAVEQEVAK